MLVSVVIPCYRSANTIRSVVEQTQAIFDGLDSIDCEFVLVNDCSPDNTFEVIKEIAHERTNVHGISLLRNFGQHSAFMCAMNYAKGDYILGMDDDLQTHPTQIPKLLGKMQEGYDVVFGVYPESKNGFLKNLSSKLNKITSRWLLSRPDGIQVSNYWMITKQLRDSVITYHNFNPNVEALFTNLTQNIGNVEVEHFARTSGSSGYTLKKLIVHWLAYFNYTVVPLRAASATGAIIALIGFIYSIYTLIKRLVRPDMAEGWSSIMCVLLIASGSILLVLGIIGEYVANISLSLNSTPQYIIRESVNIDTK